MTLIEIDAVTALDGALDHLAGASVEVPGAGERCEEWWLAISGWVVGRYERVSAVEVIEQDVRVGSAAVELARADVAQAHPESPGADRAGFSLRMGGAWLPESFTLRLEAAFENGHHVPFAVIHGRRPAPLHAPQEEAIEPISVTALPRSGSTLVIQMLAAHPEVVVAGAHPYSARPAAYWEHMVRVLSAPADARNSSHPDTFDSDHHRIGSQPFHAAPLTDAPEVRGWLGRDYVQALAAFARQSIGELYARLAAAQRIEAPRFYAEKREPGPAARLTSLVHPGGRELLVVRDLRDMACSMLAFTRNAGGRPPVAEEFIVSLVPALARLVAYAHERGTALLVVRYEDLVTQPAVALARILEHLGLDCERARVDGIAAAATQESAALAAHRTSADAASSLARHTVDLDGEARTVAEEAFAPALETFGYERSAAGAGV